MYLEYRVQIVGVGEGGDDPRIVGMEVTVDTVHALAEGALLGRCSVIL